MYTHHVQDLDLGVRTDGTRVNNVFLPPWAKGQSLWLERGTMFHNYYLLLCTDSEDFVERCREALECDYVSEHLHLWINLIFGYQRQGEEALKADNCEGWSHDSHVI